MTRSLNERLSAATDETILNGLQAYLGFILANSMIPVTEEAVEAARANLENVQQFFTEGAASNLDLQRAKAQYSSTLPQLESARNQKKMAENQLKNILNIPLGESATVVVLDTLARMDFMEDYARRSLAELTEIASSDRPEIKSAAYQAEAASQQKNVVRASYLPTLMLSADLTHQAQVNSYRLGSDDFIQSKTINMYLQIPWYDSGKRSLDYQRAQVEIEKMELMRQQVAEGINLEVEQNYYRYQEALNSLDSLRETLLQAEESLRLANLMYTEGMSTQVEVLNAQLFNTQSNLNYLEGIYNLNVSQLALLKSIGKIKTILNN
jgi:outer membrane protein TolC